MAGRQKSAIAEIDFQMERYCKFVVDFIKKDERLIMDTKYKPQYRNSNSGIIDGIRQISGYARAGEILQTLEEDKNSTEEIKCIIIFPETYKTDGDEKETGTALMGKTSFSPGRRTVAKGIWNPSLPQFFQVVFFVAEEKHNLISFLFYALRSRFAKSVYLAIYFCLQSAIQIFPMQFR